jgi:serine/threonine-protein kinase
MPTKIGHFEILSELAKSPTGTVYKANDPESGQTIALKAIQLSAYGESAGALEKALLEEAEATKVLSSPNITNVSSASEIEGQFCAAMEYVQGNSIATMLARKEGFSIWDLLDIGRQLCAALDYAGSHNIVHYSLEPAKIMCGWDGTVKILGFGVSSVGNFAHVLTDGLPPTLHYMSPEQVQGLPMDERSNLYSLGAMFYEMVTERRPFDGDGIEAVRQSIVENTLVAPVHVNPKVHPLLSELIMKALEKDPAQRYQNGREMLDDLEKCKESKPAVGKKPEAAKATAAAIPAGVKGAAQSKFVAPAAPKPVAPPVAAKPAPPPPPKPVAAAPVATTASVPSGLAKPASKLAAPKAASVAVGSSAPVHSAPTISRPADEIPELDLSNQFITASVKATLAAAEQPSTYMSSPVTDAPEIETFEPAAESAPRIAVDPMMAEGAANEGSATSFSEISELPPLKEVYIAPPPPPPDVPASTKMTPGGTMFTGTVGQEKDEKPKVNAREAAEKAIKEIKGVPPKLALYALGGAAALILAIGIGVTYYIHQQNSDDDSAKNAAAVTSAPEVSQTQQSASPAPAPAPAQDEPREIQEKAAPAERAAAPAPRERAPRKKAAPVVPVIIPGQMAIDSTPAGAQVQIDGRSDPSWVTPFAVTNLEPGAHSITVSKTGYASDSRTVQVTSGNRATASIKLAQLAATLVVNSTPAGANVYVDGHDVGAKTPAQVNIGGGQHVVLVRKMGYLDETMNAQFVLGQTFNFSPTLRPLGNVDDIRTVGKMSKIFGGKSALPGQSIVSIHTQPKGAQVSINQHIMDKNSPLDAALDPGNYVIDITMSGYAPVHKVINVDKGAKLVVDEMLQPQ